MKTKNATIIGKKRENRKLAKNIKIVNVLSYLLTTLAILAVEVRTIEIFDYIENDSHFFSIVIMAMFLMGILSLCIYGIVVMPFIKRIESIISHNNYEIFKIREQEEIEMEELYRHAKFFAIQREITELHK